jgi:hypothetical protein
MADDDELIRREASRRGLTETMFRQLRVAPTSVVQDIVWDTVGKHDVTQPSSIAVRPTASAPSERGTGWVDARPLTKQPGIDLIDQMVERQTATERMEAALKALNADEAIKRARERKGK